MYLGNYRGNIKKIKEMIKSQDSYILSREGEVINGRGLGLLGGSVG